MAKKTTTHSPNFKKLKYYYDAGFWNEHRLKVAVVKAWITEAEYLEITGEEYVAEE